MDVESAKLLGMVIIGARTVAGRLALAREGKSSIFTLPELLDEARETIEIMTELLEAAHKELLKPTIALACGVTAFEAAPGCAGLHTCERPSGHGGMHFRARPCECNRAQWSACDCSSQTPPSPDGTQR